MDILVSMNHHPSIHGARALPGGIKTILLPASIAFNSTGERSSSVRRDGM